MRYVGKLYRPPSEAHSYILQATIGCSWNNCTYCDMYRDKPVFRVRPLDESLEDLEAAGAVHGDQVDKVFIADGDGLILGMDHWLPILASCRKNFPGLRRVSCYATAENILEKSPAELEQLKAEGLSLLYIGPESGDEATMRKIAKGARPEGAARDEDYLYKAHVDAAAKAHAAGMEISAIFLLGAGGVERSEEHARGSARLATEMDPEFLSALTLTIVPGTPMAKTQERLGFRLPEIHGLLTELRVIVEGAAPSNALFRTNHASNYLPLGGRLPQDRERILGILDDALTGKIPLRPEWSRGL
jgi:radical SAM superfamily enzyme YgiQ (UPF0313 family)